MKGFIKKYYSFKEAEEDLWVDEPGEEYFRGLKSLLKMKLFWKNIKSTKGIFKYKTLEEAQQDERFTT